MADSHCSKPALATVLHLLMVILHFKDPLFAHIIKLALQLKQNLKLWRCSRSDCTPIREVFK